MAEYINREELDEALKKMAEKYSEKREFFACGVVQDCRDLLRYAKKAEVRPNKNG